MICERIQAWELRHRDQLETDIREYTSKQKYMLNTRTIGLQVARPPRTRGREEGGGAKPF